MSLSVLKFVCISKEREIASAPDAATLHAPYPRICESLLDSCPLISISADAKCEVVGAVDEGIEVVGKENQHRRHGPVRGRDLPICRESVATSPNSHV